MVKKKSLNSANEKNIVSQRNIYKGKSLYYLNKIRFEIEKKKENKFTQLKKILEFSNEHDKVETQISKDKLYLTLTLKSYNPCFDFDQIVYDAHATMGSLIVVNNIPLNPEEVIIEYGIISGENKDFEESNQILPLRDAMNRIGRNW